MFPTVILVSTHMQLCIYIYIDIYIYKMMKTSINKICVIQSVAKMKN